MLDTDALAELAQSSTREEFVAKQRHLFLVLEQGLYEEEQVGFATQVVDSVTLKRSTVRRPQNIEVLPIVKAKGNPYPDRVSVGRARNCDLVMRDPSISKLHAHFRIGAPPKVELVDIDSQNGTRVNGRALAPHQPAQVANGDTVLFGSVACKLVDAAALYDLLR